MAEGDEEHGDEVDDNEEENEPENDQEEKDLTDGQQKTKENNS
jgi:hypothetical protein